MTDRAEIALARSAADGIERSLAAGLISAKRRKASYVTVRALRLYAEAHEFELDRRAPPAIKRGEERCSAPSRRDQTVDVNHVLHAHQPELDGMHEDAIPLPE